MATGRPTRSNRRRVHLTPPSNIPKTSSTIHGAPKKAAPAKPTSRPASSQALPNVPSGSPERTPHLKTKKASLKMDATARTRLAGEAGLLTRSTQSSRGSGGVINARLARGCMKMAGSLRGATGGGKGSHRTGGESTKTIPQQKESTLQSGNRATANASSKAEFVCEGEGKSCEEEEEEVLEEQVTTQRGRKRCKENQEAIQEASMANGRYFLHSVVIPEKDRSFLAGRKKTVTSRAKITKDTKIMEAPHKRRRSAVEKGGGGT